MDQELLKRIRNNAFLLPAAIGPAVVFSLMWDARNREIRYVGEGLDGPGACFLAGVVCWVWIVKLFWCDDHVHQTPSIAGVAGWIAIQFAVAPFSILGGRVIFSFILPFGNDWGAVLGLLIGWRITSAVVAVPTQKYVTQRGTVLLP